jgi:hypothetical protein
VGIRSSSPVLMARRRGISLSGSAEALTPVHQIGLSLSFE